MSTVSASARNPVAAPPLRFVREQGAASAETLRRHFLKKYPVLRSGALPRAAGDRSLATQARISLDRGPVRPGTLPILVLRDTLDAIRPTARASRLKAGLTPVNPKTARLWWDNHLLDNLEDVLARLEKPRPILRFYDVTGLDPESGRWNSTFDLDVNFDDLGRTVQFWASDRTYVVDLGYLHADGRFLQLARTNCVDLPRDGKGPAGTGETIKTILRKSRRSLWDEEADEAARTWIQARPDHEDRDIEAELLVHMIYRSFLATGPRALRRAPALAPRDRTVLRREFHHRQRERARQAALPSEPAVVATPFLVLPLAAPVRFESSRPVRYQMLPAREVRTGWTGRLASYLAASRPDDEKYAWYRSLLASARVANARALFDDLIGESREQPLELPVAAPEPAARTADAEPVAAHVHGETDDLTLLASPVFEAAKNLRESLSGLPPIAPAANRDLFRLIRDGSEFTRRDSVPERNFGGIEAKRFAKAGVRITRMALTLEGRMRPGARLKVAGKLVHADADGRFKLECVLSGKKAAIPLRADTSIGGEARSLISVEWEKRSRETKKV
ncbi:MAG: DUF4912 domain-containing protein [Planctomycetaceae bacterium]|nr:DUF4912 domain-containing protein [Planctomycetaceae bacterium]